MSAKSFGLALTVGRVDQATGRKFPHDGDFWLGFTTCKIKLEFRQWSFRKSFWFCVYKNSRDNPTSYWQCNPQRILYWLVPKCKVNVSLPKRAFGDFTEKCAPLHPPSLPPGGRLSSFHQTLPLCLKQSIDTKHQAIFKTKGRKRGLFHPTVEQATGTTNTTEMWFSKSWLERYSYQPEGREHHFIDTV